ncbi:hypothetical protein ACQ4WX_19140 [Streptomyces lasalocidi]
MTTEQQIAAGAAVAVRAARTLGQPDSRVTSLQDHLRVTNPAKSQVLRFEFTANDPQRAARGADAFAEAYLADRSSRNDAAVQRAVDGMRTQIAALSRQTAKYSDNSADASAVQSEIGSLRKRVSEINSRDTSGGDIVRGGAAPARPAGPGASTLAVLGLVERCRPGRPAGLAVLGPRQPGAVGPRGPGRPGRARAGQPASRSRRGRRAADRRPYGRRPGAGLSVCGLPHRALGRRSSPRGGATGRRQRRGGRREPGRGLRGVRTGGRARGQPATARPVSRPACRWCRAEERTAPGTSLPEGGALVDAGSAGRFALCPGGEAGRSPHTDASRATDQAASGTCPPTTVIVGRPCWNTRTRWRRPSTSTVSWWSPDVTPGGTTSGRRAS